MSKTIIKTIMLILVFALVLFIKEPQYKIQSSIRTSFNNSESHTYLKVMVKPFANHHKIEEEIESQLYELHGENQIVEITLFKIWDKEMKNPYNTIILEIK